jgi:hypothetical protein
MLRTMAAWLLSHARAALIICTRSCTNTRRVTPAPHGRSRTHNVGELVLAHGSVPAVECRSLAALPQSDRLWLRPGPVASLPPPLSALPIERPSLLSCIAALCLYSSRPYCFIANSSQWRFTTLWVWCHFFFASTPKLTIRLPPVLAPCCMCACALGYPRAHFTLQTLAEVIVDYDLALPPTCTFSCSSAASCSSSSPLATKLGLRTTLSVCYSALHARARVDARAQFIADKPFSPRSGATHPIEGIGPALNVFCAATVDAAFSALELVNRNVVLHRAKDGLCRSACAQRRPTPT